MRARFSTPLTLLILLICSCHSPEGQTDTQAFLGTYQGKLGKSVATVVINYINGDIVSGYDVVKGIRRNLNGKLKVHGSNADFDLADPGDNHTDGRYVFTLDTVQKSIAGNWKPMHPGKSRDQTLDLKRVDKVGDSEPTSTDPMDYLTWHATETGARSGQLEFLGDGLCQYEYYLNEQDSTSQLTTIKGSYIRTKNTVTIDWEKGSLLPSRMILKLRDSVLYREYPTDTFHVLTGNGWTFKGLEPAG